MTTLPAQSFVSHTVSDLDRSASPPTTAETKSFTCQDLDGLVHGIALPEPRVYEVLAELLTFLAADLNELRPLLDESTKSWFLREATALWNVVLGSLDRGD